MRSGLKLTVSTWAVTTALLTASGVQAEVKLPHIFGSHMVLQQDKPIIVWGWADVGEAVTVEAVTVEAVTVEAAGSTQKTTATDKGEWHVTLPAIKSAAPVTMTVTASNTIKLEPGYASCRYVGS